MDWVGTVIGSLISGGLGVTIGTIYSAKKNAQVGQSGNEVEAAKATSADWSSFTSSLQATVTRLDERIVSLEAEVVLLRSMRDDDAKYISLLHAHIWSRASPPPPPRP